MDHSPIQDAIRQIDQADLTAAQYRAARRLLDVAGQTGHAKLTKDFAAERCATTSEGATRRLLGALQQAGIIHYSTNGFVYINFTAWSPAASGHYPRTFVGQEWVDEPNEPIKKSQKSDHPRALLDHPRAESDHPRAESDHGEASTYTRTRARGVCLFVDPIPSLDDLQANKQTPDPESQALAFALLSYIRVKAPIAKELAALHPLATIREAVSHWWFNRKSIGGTFDDTPGIVVYWLTNWQSAGVPPLTDRFYRTDLYRNYRTQAELDADCLDVNNDAPAESRPAPPPVQAPEPAEADPSASAWQQCCAELALTMPQVTSQWLRGSYVYAIDGATWYIAVADQRALEWLRSRLATKVQRILSSMIGESITVDFCLPEATP